MTFLPKLIRNPAGPDYHDEYAHWRAIYNILSSGKLFEPAAIIPIISDYPGLHAATAAMVSFSGLDIWQSGTILLNSVTWPKCLGLQHLAARSDWTLARPGLLQSCTPRTLHTCTSIHSCHTSRWQLRC